VLAVGAKLLVDQPHVHDVARTIGIDIVMIGGILIGKQAGQEMPPFEDFEGGPAISPPGRPAGLGQPFGDESSCQLTEGRE
jgi:hypothetical protein